MCDSLLARAVSEHLRDVLLVIKHSANLRFLYLPYFTQMVVDVCWCSI